MTTQTPRARPWGRLIADARITAGLTQTEAAERAGWTQSTWSDIECDRTVPRIDTLTAVAAAIGCPLADILPDT